MFQSVIACVSLIATCLRSPVITVQSVSESMNFLTSVCVATASVTSALTISDHVLSQAKLHAPHYAKLLEQAVEEPEAVVKMIQASEFAAMAPQMEVPEPRAEGDASLRLDIFDICLDDVLHFPFVSY